MDQGEYDAAKRRVLDVTIGKNPYLAHFKRTNGKQLAFLALMGREAFYGGAAGGGKSVALLAAALQFVQTPGYSALIIRRTYADLSRAGALIDRAAEWLSSTDAAYDSQRHRWTFPSGATLEFAYLSTEADKYNLQSTEYQFVAFDELTHFEESQYLYLFSRQRRRVGVDVPLRMRSASNPGGIGHQWVRRRFIIDRVCPFIPAKLGDNPELDQENYRRGLAMLPAVERMRLEHGDWDVITDASVFDAEGLRRLLPGIRPGRTGAVHWFEPEPVNPLELVPAGSH